MIPFAGPRDVAAGTERGSQLPRLRLAWGHAYLITTEDHDGRCEWVAERRDDHTRLPATLSMFALKLVIDDDLAERPVPEQFWQKARSDS